MRSLQADLASITATAREIAAGMAYLHADNILHGDLTAGNILLVSSPKDHRQFSVKVRGLLRHKPYGAQAAGHGLSECHSGSPAYRRAVHSRWPNTAHALTSCCALVPTDRADFGLSWWRRPSAPAAVTCPWTLIPCPICADRGLWVVAGHSGDVRQHRQP